MLVEHEQRAFALQVSHEARHGDLGRDAYQHVDVVLHEMPLDYLYSLPLAELPEDLPQVLAVLVVDCFPSILWAKHDVVLAHPFGVRKAVRFLCHGVLLSLAAGDLNNHHPRGKGVLLHSISVIHPHSGWFFALCASHTGQAHEPQMKNATQVFALHLRQAWPHLSEAIFLFHEASIQAQALLASESHKERPYCHK